MVDTAGSMEFPAMRELRIRSATAVVIIYDTSSQTSIDMVATHKKQVQQIRGTSIVNNDEYRKQFGSGGNSRGFKNRRAYSKYRTNAGDKASSAVQIRDQVPSDDDVQPTLQHY